MTVACALPAVADTDVGAVGVPPPRDAWEPRIGMLLLKEVNYSADLKSVFSRSRSVLRKRVGIIN